MATIVATVMDVLKDSQTPASEAVFRIKYSVSGPVSGQPLGEIYVQADVTGTEAQITNALKDAVALQVESLVTPPQGFARADVRGLNI